MYFNVYSDQGFIIEGYLIPDGFGAKPSINLRYNDISRGPISCDIFLSGPYEHKHHQTGVVGFKLEERDFPGLLNADEVEVSDADSGFVFYRRFRSGYHIPKRVFRLETRFAPHLEFDRAMRPFFQFHAGSAERYGSETVRQMLEVTNQPSTYVSGRVMLKSVQQYIAPESIRIASIRDPFYELAIRFSSVAAFSRKRLQYVSERDEIIFQPAVDYFNGLNFADFQAMASKIRSAPKEILALFESPFTHQLVASSPTDRISRDSVSGALDALSEFSIFSASEKDSQLAFDVAEALGINYSSVAFFPNRSPFIELADMLRDIKLLEQVLENDLILYHFVKKAEAKASSPN